MSSDLSTVIPTTSSSSQKMTVSMEFAKALNKMDLERENNNPNLGNNADNDDRSVTSFCSHASTKAPDLDNSNAADKTRHRRNTNVSALKNSGLTTL